MAIKNFDRLAVSEIDLAEAQKTLSVREASNERFEIRKAELQKELELLQQAGASVTDINNKQTEILKLEQQQRQTNSELRSQNIEKLVADTETGLNAVGSFVSAINQAQTAVLDAQIEKQEKRVEKANK